METTDMATAAHEVVADTTVALAEQCFMLRVSFGRIGNRKKIRSSQIEVNADREWVNATKKLLESEELDAIQSADNLFMQRLDLLCVPGLDSGVRMIKHQAVERAVAMLKDHRDVTRPPLIDAFIARLSELEREAERRLHAPGHAPNCQCHMTLFNPADYWTETEARAKFSFDWRFFNMGTPDKLRSVNESVWVEEREKLRQEFRSQAEEIRVARRATFAELLNHLKDRLADDTDGKRKKLHETAVTHLAEFLDNFELTEVNNDQELRTYVDQVRQLTKGLDVSELKDNNYFRKRIHNSLDDVMKKIDTWVVAKPARKMSLE